jgi:hypothetical protein
MLLDNPIRHHREVRLFSNKNEINIIYVKILPTEDDFIKFYVSENCLKYGACCFVDIYHNKRTFVMNWNLPDIVYEALERFHFNQISADELHNISIQS